MKNRKGFTLIETVVAMGILGIAMAGALTAITAASHLALDSRDTTVANGLAQQLLSEYIPSSQNTCGTNLPTSGIKTTSSVTENGITYNRTLTMEDDNDFEDTDPSTPYVIPSKSFAKITATVTWGSGRKVRIFQYVKRGYK